MADRGLSQKPTDCLLLLYAISCPESHKSAQEHPCSPLPASQSEMVRLDMPAASALAPSIAARISGVGTKSHGLVEWEGGFVSLDSDSGALVWVELGGGEAEGSAPTIKAHTKVLWKVR